MPPNLAAALVKAQAEIGLISKSGKNERFSFTYPTLEDYNSGIHAALVENKLSIITSVAEVKHHEPRGGDKLEYVVEVDLCMTLVHESGEIWQISCAGQGQDQRDAAMAKAITAARKAGLALMFNLSTQDDPENDQKDRPDKKKPGATGSAAGPGVNTKKEYPSDKMLAEIKELPGAAALEAWFAKNKNAIATLPPTPRAQVSKAYTARLAEFQPVERD